MSAAYGYGGVTSSVDVGSITEMESSRHHSLPQSGYRGVSQLSGGGGWRASLSSQASARNLGTFESAEDAARAYDDAARALYRDKARVNFPTTGERTAGGRSQYTGLSWVSR